jgi:O-antigen/teichoic acid export membrane protein
LCASLLSIALLLVLTLFGWDGSRLLRPTLYLALAAVFADIGGLVQTILCAKQRFVAATSLRFASALLSLAVVSGTALVTRDESAVIVAYAAADVAIAATAWIVLLTVLPRRAAVALHLSKIRQLAADWPEMRRYLGWSWLSSTTMAGLSRADEFVASFVASPEAIGLYKIAKNIFQVVQGFMSAMLEAAFVDVASYWTLGAYDRLRRAVRNITVAGVGFASLAGAAIVFAGQPVIARLYGAQFADAYPLALVLAIGMWCLPFFWLHAVLRVGSKLHVLVAAEAVATAAAIAAMFGAGSFWGIVGVAVGRISFDVVFSSVGLAYAAVHRATLFGRHRDAHPLHAAHPAPLFVTAQEGVRD